MTFFSSLATAGMPSPIVDSAPAGSVEVARAQMGGASWIKER